MPSRSRECDLLSNVIPRPSGVVLRPGIALVLLTALVSGISSFVNFRAVQGTNVAAWITVRNLAVAVALLPFAALLGRAGRPRLSPRSWAHLVLIGLLGGAVPFLLYFEGFQMAAAAGGAASASLGYRTLFLFATAFGVLFLRERLPRRFVLAAGLLLGGSVLIVGVTGPVWTDGTAYVIAATALWAGEYTLSKRVLRDLPARIVALGRMGFGAGFLLAYLTITGQVAAISSFGVADWMNAGLSALLLFAFVTTWYAGLKTLDLSMASSLLVLAFPITWLLGVIWSGAVPAWVQAVGAVAVVLGAGLLVTRWRPRGSTSLVHSVVEATERRAPR